MAELAEIVKQTKAWACYDCGKCTSTCPITRAGADYSPRRHVLATNLDTREQLIGNGALFTCLTCSLCDKRCPAQVAYTELILKLREMAYRDGMEPECPHGGALQSVMRMMAKGGTKQDRLSWLSKDLQTETAKGEVFFWTGCSMYYDAFFADLKVATLHATRSAVKVLNKLGTTPVVSPEERCCGHDLLWNGDRANFERLAKHNVKLVADSGAKVLVTTCAECLRTWRMDYLPMFQTAPPKIMHLTEYLAEHKGKLQFKPNGRKRVTYQDPCRLGRHLGIYDPPRQAMNAIPGLELVEMRHAGPRATCCAGGTWSNCDRYAKAIQVERLREARDTGAQTLVTACPKCQVHLACAMHDPKLGDQIKIEMRDVVELVADALA
jgi:heterodisulfide reductase subunit D